MSENNEMNYINKINGIKKSGLDSVLGRKQKNTSKDALIGII